ncbi:MAG: hypothetical protein Fur002_14300 [Anaerolineales bacterium]
MKRNRPLFVLLAVLTALFVLACQALSGGSSSTPAQEQQPGPVATEAPTQKPVATEAPTEAPIATEAPTEIVFPPTPGKIGDVVVTDGLYEVTVQDARILNRVYMGSYYYYPKDNQMFVELVIKATNLTGAPASIPWQNIYVTEASGDSWYPNWAGYKAVSVGKKVDGASVGVNEVTDGEALVEFNEDVYIRAIWFLTKDDSIIFGFDQSPEIQILFK